MKEMAPLVAFAVSLLVFGWVIFRMVVRRNQQRAQARTPRQQLLETKQSFDRLDSRGERALRDAPNDVLRWQVEMQETARDLRGELESKAAVLAAATRLADQRIAELKSLIEQAEALQQKYQR